MTIALRPHAPSETWKADQLYDDPYDAVDAAKKLAAETTQPVDLGTDARNWLQAHPDGRVEVIHEWAEMYKGEPSADYIALMLAF